MGSVSGLGFSRNTSGLSGTRTQLSSSQDSVTVILMHAAWLAPNHTPQEVHFLFLGQDLCASLEAKVKSPGNRDLRGL